jgi:hypothetical protein
VGAQEGTAHLGHGRGHRIGRAGPALRRPRAQVPSRFAEGLFQAPRGDDPQDACGLGGDSNPAAWPDPGLRSRIGDKAARHVSAEIGDVPTILLKVLREIPVVEVRAKGSP